jgi:hypothetical protein
MDEIRQSFTRLLIAWSGLMFAAGMLAGAIIILRPWVRRHAP